MKTETWTENEQDEIMARLIPWYEKHLEKIILWDNVEVMCNEDPQRDDDNNLVGYALLGTVFDLMPSGKYWTSWACSNVDQREMIKDTAFSEALNIVVERHGYDVISGENDPCDIFICKYFETEEDE